MISFCSTNQLKAVFHFDELIGVLSWLCPEVVSFTTFSKQPVYRHSLCNSIF